jgi:Asp-tRNA(Asn)/Glu-tRNA(Gln) amidotransferase C subunit
MTAPIKSILDENKLDFFVSGSPFDGKFNSDVQIKMIHNGEINNNKDVTMLMTLKPSDTLTEVGNSLN